MYARTIAIVTAILLASCSQSGFAPNSGGGGGGLHGGGEGEGSGGGTSGGGNTVSDPTAFNPATDLTYLGAFRLPESGTNPASFSYGGEAAAFDPANNTLVISGHAQGSYVASVSIPTPIISGSLNALNTAAIALGFCDPVDGNLGDIDPGDPNQKKFGGFLMLPNSIVVSGYNFYDGDANAIASHFLKDTANLCSTANVRGPYKVSSFNPGYTAGYMSPVPTSLQARLGGPAITGLSNVAITGRTSQGPAAFPFDPAQLGVSNPVPATPLMAYPLDHPYPPGYPNGGFTTAFDSATNPWNAVSTIRGFFIHEKSQSLVYFGQQLMDAVCYKGDNCSDGGGFGTVTGRAKTGVWVFKISELEKVKNGTLLHHQVPLAGWHEIVLPISNSKLTGGIAYDPGGNRLFIIQRGADPGGGYFSGPLVHVYQPSK